MRRLFTLLIVLVSASQLGCSVINNFVVINASLDSVEVSYNLKHWNGLTPSTKPLSQVGQQVAWQELPQARYTIDSTKRNFVLRLNAGEALLVDQCSPAHGESSGNCEPSYFQVERIAITGAAGKIDLQGEQAHRAFVYENEYRSYTLTYK